MSQSERVNYQYLTFWVSINEKDASQAEESLTAEQQVWTDSFKKLAHTNKEHPLYRFQETHDGMELEFFRWELTEDLEIEVKQNLIAFPVTFFTEQRFSLEVLKALKEMVEQTFAQVTAEQSATARLILVETETQIVRTEREVLAGL